MLGFLIGLLVGTVISFTTFVLITADREGD